MNAATRAAIPTRVDVDGQPCRAFAGIIHPRRFGVYWALDGGRQREWILFDVSLREALRIAGDLNARQAGRV